MSKWVPSTSEYIGVYAYSVQFDPMKKIFRVRVRDHMAPNLRRGYHSRYSFYKFTHATELMAWLIEHDHDFHCRPNLKNTIESIEKRRKARKRKLKSKKPK